MSTHCKYCHQITPTNELITYYGKCEDCYSDILIGLRLTRCFSLTNCSDVPAPNFSPRISSKPTTPIYHPDILNRTFELTEIEEAVYGMDE